MQTVTSIPEPVLDPCTNGGRLVDADGRVIPLRVCSIDVEARGGLARVILRQTFRNPFAEPLQATYQFGLPAEAAVGGYSFTIGNCRIVGEIDRLEAARERFEEAILEGRTAGLVEQDRSTFFTQEIGNIPAHGEVTCELEIDQPLRWLEDGQWEWRFPTTIAPRYMGGARRVPDRERTSVDVTDEPMSVRLILRMNIQDERLVAPPTSATHRLGRSGEGDVVFESDAGVPLDRDVVIRWTVASPEVGLTVDTARAPSDHPCAASAFALVTLVPPSFPTSDLVMPRDVILLLDTSGSMNGAALEAAQNLALGVIASLGSEDRLEMIEFSSLPRRWDSEPKPCTESAKGKASKWVRSLRAGGGTEMRSGLMEALEDLRSEAQRQVVLITDGLVGFDGDVVAAVRKHTPNGCRVHTVGIGSASNRSLTHAVAQAGRGGELLVDLNDSIADASARLVSRLSKPLVVDVRVSGSAVLEVAGPETCDLLAGSPVLVPVKLRPEGGSIIAEGRTPEGMWTACVEVAAIATSSGRLPIVRQFGRSCVERIELDAAVGAQVNDDIEALGLAYRIATRRTSWVAISEERTVDPTEPIRRVRIPQQLPYGMSAEGLGLRPSSGRFEDVAWRMMSVCDVAYPTNRVARGHRAPEQARASMPPPEIPTADSLLARILSHRDDTLVLEIELTQDLDWDPAKVNASFAAHVQIDTTSTTRAGSYGPGQRLRIVIVGIPRTVRTDAINGVTIISGSGSTMELHIRP